MNKAELIEILNKSIKKLTNVLNTINNDDTDETNVSEIVEKALGVCEKSTRKLEKYSKHTKSKKKKNKNEKCNGKTSGGYSNHKGKSLTEDENELEKETLHSDEEQQDGIVAAVVNNKEIEIVQSDLDLQNSIPIVEQNKETVAAVADVVQDEDSGTEQTVTNNDFRQEAAVADNIVKIGKVLENAADHEIKKENELSTENLNKPKIVLVPIERLLTKSLCGKSLNVTTIDLLSDDDDELLVCDITSSSKTKETPENILNNSKKLSSSSQSNSISSKISNNSQIKNTKPFKILVKRLPKDLEPLLEKHGLERYVIPPRQSKNTKRKLSRNEVKTSNIH